MTTLGNEQPGVSRWQRSLLPADLLEKTETGRRSPRDWLVDALVFAFAIAIGAASLVETWQDHSTAGVVADIALGAVACLALWWRRRFPLGVALLVVTVAAVATTATGAATLAVFGLAVRGSRRALVAVAALALVSMGIASAIYPSPGSWITQMLFGLLILGVAISWGLFTRVRRQLILSLRERAERLEAEQRWHVEQAREAERRRIAREMHDVLAHRLSLLSVHAGALEFRPDAPPDEVAQAAGVIRETAQSALQELRDVIGVLREDGDEGVPEPPQPTLAQIPALIEESRAAGMNVGYSADGVDEAAPPEALGRTAYRVVQEGLTNARKHAAGAGVTVTVEAGPPLVVEVVSRRAVGTTGVDRSTGPGTGLVGLAERVEFAGGELDHGRNGNGDFVLRATLPWTRA